MPPEKAIVAELNDDIHERGNGASGCVGAILQLHQSELESNIAIIIKERDIRFH